MKAAERTCLKKLAERWIYEGWQKGRAALVDERHAPAFVDYDSASRRPDREGFKQGIVELYAAFPDFHARIVQGE